MLLAPLTYHFAIVSFFPPMDEDYECIKEEEKDKMKKNNKGKEEEKKQFPVRTFKTDYEVAQHVKEFLLEFDFVVVMTLVTVMTFITTQIVRIFDPEAVSTTFIYYIIIFLVVLVVYYTVKQNMFPFELNDENKILLLFAIKAFLVNYMILGYFTDYFDFGMEEGLKQQQIQLNKITEVAGKWYCDSSR